MQVEEKPSVVYIVNSLSHARERERGQMIEWKKNQVAKAIKIEFPSNRSQAKAQDTDVLRTTHNLPGGKDPLSHTHKHACVNTKVHRSMNYSQSYVTWEITQKN